MKPTTKVELLDERLKNFSQPADLLGPDGLLTELKNRGLTDIFICCGDGLERLRPRSRRRLPPKCRVPRCIVHHLRNSHKWFNWIDRKQIASNLKTIYSADGELWGIRSPLP